MKYGTIKCITLQQIRIKIAELNGLTVNNKVCSFADNCISGTCPLCEKELERLEKAIFLKIERGEKVWIHSKPL